MPISNSTGLSYSIPQSSDIAVMRALNVTAANSSITLPENSKILDVIIFNNTANAITGGLKIGTTNGAVDIVAALAIGANSYVTLGTGILKSIFSASLPQQIFIDAVIAWNSANINISIPYVKL